MLVGSVSYRLFQCRHRAEAEDHGELLNHCPMMSFSFCRAACTSGVSAGLGG